MGLTVQDNRLHKGESMPSRDLDERCVDTYKVVPYALSAHRPHNQTILLS
jgi:hypothetical protein